MNLEDRKMAGQASKNTIHLYDQRKENNGLVSCNKSPLHSKKIAVFIRGTELNYVGIHY